MINRCYDLLWVVERVGVMIDNYNWSDGFEVVDLL